MTKQQPLGGPHEALNDMVDGIGLAEGGSKDAGPRLAADFLAVGRTTLYKMLDAGEPMAELSFVRVAQLTGRFKVRQAAVYLARLVGCELVSFRHGHHSETPYEALAHMVKEVGEGQGAAADYVRNPKKATPGQRKQAVKELDEGIEAMIEMRQRVLDGDDA